MEPKIVLLDIMFMWYNKVMNPGLITKRIYKWLKYILNYGNLECSMAKMFDKWIERMKTCIRYEGKYFENIFKNIV